MGEDVVEEIRRQYFELGRYGIEAKKLYLSPGSFRRLRMAKDYCFTHAPSRDGENERFMGMEIFIAYLTAIGASSDDSYIHVC